MDIGACWLACISRKIFDISFKIYNCSAADISIVALTSPNFLIIKLEMSSVVESIWDVSCKKHNLGKHHSKKMAL